jgi:hypothetical protein
MKPSTILTGAGLLIILIASAILMYSLYWLINGNLHLTQMTVGLLLFTLGFSIFTTFMFPSMYDKIEEE